MSSSKLEDQVVQIYWTSSLWKKAAALLTPALQKWVVDNKGKSKKYIHAEALLRLNSWHVPSGFFARQMTAESHSVPLVGGVPPLGSYVEIERAILKTAVAEGLLPAAIQFMGKPLIQAVAAKTDSVNAATYGFLYFVRNGELVKIGITENLLRRLSELKPDEVLNVSRCKNYQELERELHQEFKQHRLPQTEYFRLSSSQIQAVHRLIAERSIF